MEALNIKNKIENKKYKTVKKKEEDKKDLQKLNNG